MIVDFHVHVFPPSIKADRAPYLQDAVFRSIYNRAGARIATAEDLIASMDRSGVDVSVLQGFAWRSHDHCAAHNDYLLEAAARYPGRLLPFCTLQPAAGAAAQEELTRCLAGPAAPIGIGELRPDEQGCEAPGWPAMAALRPSVLQHGLVVLLHATEPVGHLYPGKGSMTPDRLSSLVAALPGCSLVLAHLGGGLAFYQAMPEVRALLADCYVDTAAWPLLYGPEVFSPLVALTGPERILFGSDFPLLDQALEVRRLRDALPEHAVDPALGGNALRLLNLQ